VISHELELIHWIEKNIPKDCKPREVAILTFYHFFNIKNPSVLAKVLHYTQSNTVNKKLKKFRGKLVIEVR
jgi:hypothetical protein